MSQSIQNLEGQKVYCDHLDEFGFGLTFQVLLLLLIGFSAIPGRFCLRQILRNAFLPGGEPSATGRN